MEGVEFEGVDLQIRSHNDPPPSNAHPLPLDKKLKLNDKLREATERLKAKLQGIEAFYISSQAPTHSASPDCIRCIGKKDAVTQAWHEFYTVPEFGLRLNGKLVAFDNVSDPDTVLTTITHQARKDLRNQLCTAEPCDTSAIRVVKEETAELFDNDRNITDILTFYRSAIERTVWSQDESEFVKALERTKTAAERAPLYAKYYCTPEWNETSQQKNFKAKYARMFQDLVPHDEVMAIMRKEAADFQKGDQTNKASELSDLKMAQSAHLKNKTRKREKVDRMNAVNEPDRRLERCAFDRCGRDVNLNDDEGVIECAICEWLDRQWVRDQDSQGRFFYCSAEHAENDFDEHDHHEHACCMNEYCMYSPQSGPPGETGAGGICQDCRDEEFISYFCSQECYQHNLDRHRDTVHHDRRIQSLTENLELFKSAEDMEIVS